MNQRNTNNGTPQPIETNDEFDLPPPAPVREPDKKLPVREPNRKKPTEIV